MLRFVVFYHAANIKLDGLLCSGQHRSITGSLMLEQLFWLSS